MVDESEVRLLGVGPARGSCGRSDGWVLNRCQQKTESDLCEHSWGQRGDGPTRSTNASHHFPTCSRHPTSARTQHPTTRCSDIGVYCAIEEPADVHQHP